MRQVQQNPWRNLLDLVFEWIGLRLLSQFETKKLGPHHIWMRAPGKKRRRKSILA